ncbi:MAG: BatA domain-containing protein [Pirellula sp.]|nr:BatA domain-containing protein [Pirellula sp.]
MTFLQPWMLFALPLLALPIIIHLVHLRRHQTVPWAAMRFLLAATKMASGLSKLKQYLILALRTLAVATLVLFASRPLISGISGWLGTEESQLSIVVVDRSPSMQLKLGVSGETKQQMAVQRVQEWLSASGNSKIICLATGYEEPIADLDVQSLASDPRLEPTAMSSNIPVLLDKAREYIERNNVAKATVWIASDLSDFDWRTSDSTWSVVRDGFSKTAADVSFQILDLTPQAFNRAIKVTGAELTDGGAEDELQLSLQIKSNPIDAAPAEETISVELEIGGNRTAIPVSLERGYGEVNRFPIKFNAAAQMGSAVATAPTESQSGTIGWGSVRIAADANEADNIAYFTFETKPLRKTLIVSDNPTSIEAITMAASIPPNPTAKTSSDQVTVNQLDTVNWDQYAVVIWHEQLPLGSALELTEKFVNAGGQILFLPPEIPNSTTAYGIQWTAWKSLTESNSTEVESQASGTGEKSAAVGARVEQWRNDSLLLGNTMSGTALPLSALQVSRVCRITGNMTELATLEGDIGLLVRSDAVSEQSKGDVYALCTTTAIGDSTLAKDGIAIYVMIQRLLDAGMPKVGSAKSIAASMEQSKLLQDSQPLAIAQQSLSSQQWEQAGVFSRDKLLIAQNRTHEEDESKIVGDDSLQSVFGELKWYKIDAVAATSSLVQEVWRWFAILMLIALLAEGVLSAPSKRIKGLKPLFPQSAG